MRILPGPFLFSSANLAARLCRPPPQNCVLCDTVPFDNIHTDEIKLAVAPREVKISCRIVTISFCCHSPCVPCRFYVPFASICHTSVHKIDINMRVLCNVSVAQNSRLAPFTAATFASLFNVTTYAIENLGDKWIRENKAFRYA